MSDEQVNERESLARVLAEALASGMAPTQARVVRVWGRDGGDASAGVEANVWAGTPRDVADELADAALAWFAEHRAPRVVSTVEEVESMPPGTVFRDRIWGSILYRRDDDLAPIGTVVGGGYWIANGWEVLFTPATESDEP